MAPSSTFSSSAINEGPQEYPYPSHVNTASFLSIKLSSITNYDRWKEQMMCLVKSHDMLDFIHGTSRPPPGVSVDEARKWERSDTLVKGWILGSLSEDAMRTVVGLETAEDVWKKLETAYTIPARDDSKKDQMRCAPLYRAILEANWDAAEPYLAYQLNIWFAKLNDEGNTALHLAIGTCKNVKFFNKVLDKITSNIRAHKIALNIVDKIVPNISNYIANNITYNLAWIIAEIIDHNVAESIDDNIANNIVEIIAPNRDENIASNRAHNIASNIARNIANNLAPNIANNIAQNIAHNIAHNIVKMVDNVAHRENNVARNRANKRKPMSLQDLVSNHRWNALHHAAAVGNIKAAEKLVEKDPHLLFKFSGTKYLPIQPTKAAEKLVEKDPHLSFKFSCTQYLPIHFSIFAISALHKPTFRFLLKASKDHIELSKKEGYHNPFEGGQGVVLLIRVINAGFTEVAYELIKAYPAMATAEYYFDTPLETIVKKFDLYYSQPRNDRIFDQDMAEEFRARRPDDQSQDQRQNVPPEDQDERQDIENPDVLEELLAQGPDVGNQLPALGPDAENQYPQLDELKDFPGNEVKENKPLQVLRSIYNEVRKLRTLYSHYMEAEVKDNKPRLVSIKLTTVPQMEDCPKDDFPEDEVKDNKPLLVLRLICKEVSKLDTHSEICRCYLEAATLAVRYDIPKALEEITRHSPEAIWAKHEGYNLIELAIIKRCEKVYNFFIHEMNDNKYFLKIQFNKDRNNLLHLAGKLAPVDELNEVSGAALQMQRELQWFKEVEKFVFLEDKEAKNIDEDTPMMVFIREHEKLRKQGEEWMKKTADSYTITAALIITIVFAAAITVPGGNDGTTGKAIYATKPSFIIFAVSDAISLFTSTTSLLLFLSILTARYQLEDFHHKLPTRLILGLVMLFLSVTSMMVAFSATLYIMFGQGKAWILIPIAALTCLPIVSFMMLQLPLLKELISSTYGYGIFG